MPKASTFYLGSKNKLAKHLFVNLQHNSKAWAVGEFTVNMVLSDKLGPPSRQIAFGEDLERGSDGAYQLTQVGEVSSAADHIDFIAAMLADAEVTRYYERTFTRAEAQAWLGRQLDRYAHDGHGLWLVLDREGGNPVGQVGLAMQEVEGARHPEIGWLRHRPFWGKGYATEAAMATRDAAFKRWGYPPVVSLIRPVNEPSRRVAQRIGMRPGRQVPFHGFEHTMFVAEARDRG